MQKLQKKSAILVMMLLLSVALGGCANQKPALDLCSGIDFIWLSDQDTLETQKQVVIHNETLEKKR